MPGSTPQSYTAGISTAQKGTVLQKFGAPDPFKYVVDYDDFITYTAADWTVTETQAGATQAVAAEAAGGNIVLTNSAADDDVNMLTRTQEVFKWAADKRMFFKCRFKVSDATQSDVAIGLSITDTSPVASAPTDAFYFLKTDGAATMVFKVGKNSTYTTSSTIATLTSDTFLTVGFAYNGKTYVDPTVPTVTNYVFEVYVNDVKVADVNVPSTNVCDDEFVTTILALQNGEAVAKILTVDYFIAAQER